MAATPSENDSEEQYEVTVTGFRHVNVSAKSRDEAMEIATERTDFGDLSINNDDFRVDQTGGSSETLYNVYKNGELVEEEKPMSDAKANRLDGHTQFNDEEKDFEKFRVEEV